MVSVVVKALVESLATLAIEGIARKKGKRSKKVLAELEEADKYGPALMSALAKIDARRPGSDGRPVLTSEEWDALDYLGDELRSRGKAVRKALGL